MEQVQPKLKQSAVIVQLFVTFVVPIIILSRFSGETQLGAVKGFLIALAFPVAYEAYRLLKRQRPSILSLVAIGGIALTGGISLLGLNEDWLAARRALPFRVVALVFLISDLIKRPVFGLVLPYLLDMPRITKRVHKNNTLSELDAVIKRAGYWLSIVLILVALANFGLTKAIILSATDTTAFNQEYARLRLLSIPVVTLPLIIGIAAVLYYLASTIEKLTGLDFEEILKKKDRKP